MALDYQEFESQIIINVIDDLPLETIIKVAAKRWLDNTVFKQTEIEKLRSMVND